MEAARQAIIEALNSSDFDAAAALSDAALPKFTDEPSLIGLTIVAFFKAGQPARAIEMNRKLLAINPGDVNLHKQLVDLCLAAGDTDGAVAGCNAALRQCGDDNELANWFFDTWVETEWNRDNIAECQAPLRRQLRLYPDNVQAHRRLSCVLIRLGEADDALETFMQGCVVPWDSNAESERAAVEDGYNAMALAYDDNSLHLSFSLRLIDFMTDIIGRNHTFSILDAGCGTGKAGENLKPMARQLTGFDISQGMLDQAQRLGVYDRLFKAGFDDMYDGAAASMPFDLIVSSCALYHAADLNPVFEQSAKLLNVGGYLFFSVDPAPDHMDIGVTKDGAVMEYAHSRAYLRRLAAQHGFKELEIAVMMHRPNPGFWCGFRKRQDA